jgi:hypothetical protein
VAYGRAVGVAGQIRFYPFRLALRSLARVLRRASERDQRIFRQGEHFLSAGAQLKDCCGRCDFVSMPQSYVAKRVIYDDAFQR